jgi:hypothetical protein
MPQPVVGDCPSSAPSFDDPCPTIGTACVYCAESAVFSCSQPEPFLMECCARGWEVNCLPPTCTAVGDSGQAGEGGAPASGGDTASGGASDCSLPPGCCDADADCPTGFECAPPYSGPSTPGVCKPKLALQGRCWRDTDCPAGNLCTEALVCTCGGGCNDDDPGRCASQP